MTTSRLLRHVVFVCVALVYLAYGRTASADSGGVACDPGQCCVWVWGTSRHICEVDITIDYACWDAYHNVGPGGNCYTFTTYDPDWAEAGDCEQDDVDGLWWSTESFACYHTLIEG